MVQCIVNAEDNHKTSVWNRVLHFSFYFHLSVGIVHPTTCPLPSASSAKSKEGIIPTGFQCERVLSTFSAIFTFRLLLFIIYWPLLMFAFHNCSQFSVAVGYGGSFGSYFDWNLWFKACMQLFGYREKIILEGNSAIRTIKYKVHDTRYITSIKWRSIV